ANDDRLANRPLDRKPPVVHRRTDVLDDDATGKRRVDLRRCATTVDECFAVNGHPVDCQLLTVNCSSAGGALSTAAASACARRRSRTGGVTLNTVTERPPSG